MRYYLSFILLTFVKNFAQLQLIYKASAVIDGIISLRMFFFLIFLADLRMNHRICLFIHNIVENSVDDVLLSDN